MRREKQDKSNLGRHACHATPIAPVWFQKLPDDLLQRDLAP